MPSLQFPPHGGDIYAFSGELLDFSCNVNPLGMPPAVKSAAVNAIERSSIYPDPYCRELRSALADFHGVSPAFIQCGNGAAQLIYTLAAALASTKAVITAPTFSEYETALSAFGCEVFRHILRREDGFALTESILEEITEDIGLVILCNPNNPTGNTSPKELMASVLARCEECGATLLVDECFMDFLPNAVDFSLLPLLSSFPRLIILKAFTKTYAMAGLRLGYCLCGDEALLARMESFAQPWSVSTPAQAAGISALSQGEYLAESIALIATQRQRLSRELEQLGFVVFPSVTNYLCFYCKVNSLYPRMLAEGILLRSCENYHGLQDGYYRVAVRCSGENDRLIAALKKLCGEDEA